MERKQIIEAAVSLLNDRETEYRHALNETGRARVPVLSPAPATRYDGQAPAKSDGPHVVEFSIMQHSTGQRLVAEYEGRSEFVA